MSKNDPRLVFRQHPDELADLLAQLQLIVVQYPIAAQALFRALVAEGKAFAKTPDGAEWAARLAGSAMVRRGRLAWDVLTLRAFDDDPEVTIPSVFLDALAKTAAMDALEPLLSRMFEESAAHDANQSARDATAEQRRADDVG
jgi:hypothetical protein